MRTLTAAETAALQAAVRRNGAKVEVQNGSGTWVDYTDWLLRIGVGGSIDQKIASATVTLRRDRSPASQYSLAPYMTTSDLNVLDDGTTYSPAVDLGRRIRISLATVAAGTAPAAGDYRFVFDGYVRDIDPTGPEMKVEAKDLGVLLRDRLVESETTYLQQAMEDMIQSILTDWAGVTLYSTNGDATTPFKATDAPGYTVNETAFDGITVWEAIEKITQLNGWVARYRWNANVGAFVFTLYEPDRAKTVADWTHGPDRYFDVRGLRTRIDNIRNRIGGWYHDASGVKQVVAPVKDTASIDQYGSQYMAFREGPESPIDTLSEWTTMASQALSDLKDPDAEQEIELPLFWPVEIEDLNAFVANGIHYDTDQKWAVVGYRHELDFTQQPSRERTSITVRGSVAGSYRSWLRRKGDREAGSNPDLTLSVTPLEKTETAHIYRITRDDAAIAEVWRYSRTVPQNAVVPDIETVQAEDDPVILPIPAAGYVDVTIPVPEPDTVTYEWYVGYTADWQPGVVAGPVEVDPLDRTAEVVGLDVAYDGAGSGVITAGTNTEAETLEWQYAGDTTWVSEPVVDQEAQWPVAQTKAERTIYVRALNAFGQAGPERSLDLEAYDPAPALLSAFLDVDESPAGSDADYSFSWDVSAGVNDTDHRIRLIAYEEDSGIKRIDTSGVLPSASPYTERGTGDPNSLQANYRGKVFLYAVVGGETLGSIETPPTLSKT